MRNNRWKSQREDMVNILISELAADSAKVTSMEVLEASDRMVYDRVGTPQDDHDYFYVEFKAICSFDDTTQDDVTMTLLADIHSGCLANYHIIHSSIW